MNTETSKKSDFRLTSKNFVHTAVSLNSQHFFPYEECVYIHQDDKISMDYAFFQRNRLKWYCDKAYLTVEQAKAIVDYAIKRGIMNKRPSALTKLIEKESSIA